MITTDNWHLYYYETPQLRAFISEGADRNGILEFYLTVTTSDFAQELFQQAFTSEEQAVDTLNKRYGNWKQVLRDGNHSCSLQN